MASDAHDSLLDDSRIEFAAGFVTRPLIVSCFVALAALYRDLGGLRHSTTPRLSSSRGSSIASMSIARLSRVWLVSTSNFRRFVGLSASMSSTGSLLRSNELAGRKSSEKSLGVLVARGSDWRLTCLRGGVGVLYDGCRRLRGGLDECTSEMNSMCGM